MNNRIYIRDLIAAKPSYPDAGALLYERAHAMISAGEPVFIDLEDVTSFPTTFMNVSFGRFITEFGKQKTMQSLNFLNIRRTQFERIKRYFETYEG